MVRRLLIALFMMALAACRPAPFKVQTLKEKSSKIEPTDRRLVNEFQGVLDETMAARYKRAKSPSFALIHGFYRLPKAKPFGAASIVRGYSYQTYFESVEIEDHENGLAIEPISGNDALAFERALNSLLNIGVKIKDIAMSDAVTIAKAEGEALKKGEIFLSAKLTPDVDYLMSIYKSNSKQGPVLIGRVIKKDGTLQAFRVVYGGAADHQVGGLIITLFEDTIGRI